MRLSLWVVAALMAIMFLIAGLTGCSDNGIVSTPPPPPPAPEPAPEPELSLLVMLWQHSDGNPNHRILRVCTDNTEANTTATNVKVTVKFEGQEIIVHAWDEDGHTADSRYHADGNCSFKSDNWELYRWTGLSWSTEHNTGALSGEFPIGDIPGATGRSVQFDTYLWVE